MIWNQIPMTLWYRIIYELLFPSSWDALTSKKSVTYSIGYGIDGATPEVWKSIWKSQNLKKYHEVNNGVTKKKPSRLLNGQKNWHGQRYWWCSDIQKKHTNHSSWHIHFVQKCRRNQETIPRPHVSKTVFCEQRHSKTENHAIVEQFISDPTLFQALDYTALPSELTHPNNSLKKATSAWYRKICALDPDATKYVIPNTPHYREIANRKNTTVTKMNEGKFDQ